MSAVKNFLRRWSTIEITDDNAFLFEENLIGVRANNPDEVLLDGLTKNTPREEFGRRARGC